MCFVKKIIRKYWWILPLILVIGIVGFVFWGETAAPPMPEATAALQSDLKVKVTTEPWIIFTPQEIQPKSGLIFYPGGRVDPRAYAPMARAIAEQGYLVVIVPMPLNLAVFSPAKAEQVIQAYPEIQNWVIGGHSLGGSMAANYARKNPQAIEGLALLGSYPASSDNLSNSNLQVLSIFGTNDGLVTAGKIDKSHALLPENTVWVPIQGGNHAQLGYYGPQSGDNPATVSREDQQKAIVEAILALMNKIGS